MDTTNEAAALPNLRRRQLLIAGAAVAVIAAGGGYYAWNSYTRGQSKPSVAEPPGGADVPMAELMLPGPLGDNSLGSPDAPVTIVEYASMTCPHCAHFHETAFPELKKKYIDTGKVRFIFREFPLDSLALAGSMLARCAGTDRFFPMIETLFAQKKEWVVQKPLQPMLSLARQAGFSQQSFDECLANQDMQAGIEETRTRAMKLGVNSTPTFFINGKIFRGGLTTEELDKQLAPYLKA
jgi:protein-disulfide isomerase